MAATLSDLEVAAALAELIYRRNSKDLPVTLGPLGDIVGKNDPDIVKPLSLTKNDGFYYDDAIGFVGQVVDANDKIFVVFRGTDFEGGLTGVDFTDGNVPLALGTFDNTQLDDAIALTKAAMATGKTVIVTGHSLGGGLAWATPASSARSPKSCAAAWRRCPRAGARSRNPMRARQIYSDHSDPNSPISLTPISV
jgi:hypothetical protein